MSPNQAGHLWTIRKREARRPRSNAGAFGSFYGQLGAHPGRAARHLPFVAYGALMIGQLPELLLLGANLVVLVCVFGTLRQILDVLRVRQTLGEFPERMS